jgi:hypothetical protein
MTLLRAKDFLKRIVSFRINKSHSLIGQRYITLF